MIRPLLSASLAILLASSSASSAQAQAPAPAAPEAAAAPTPAAPQDNPHLWKPRVKSVAVFKDGFGFFMREGEATLRDGWVVAKEVPPATFGTLAIYSLNEKEVVDVVGSGPGEVVQFDGVDAPTDIEAKRARLSSADQLSVQLTYSYKGAERSAAGKLVSHVGEFAVLETDTTSFAVPIREISKLQILDLPLRVHVTSEAEQQPTKAQVGMAYLRQGITWIPDYSLKVLDDTTAELTLRGTVVNEAEDLVHCDVNFVVGVPHFAHTGYMAPIAVGQVIRTIGAAVALQEIQTQIMNRAAIASNSIRSNQFEQQPEVVEQAAGDQGGNLQQALGNLPQLEGPGQGDYTVYTKKDLTLRRGERAIVTLFVKKIKFAHLYRWAPPARMEHFLVLRNDTGTAWTTGPCLAMSGGRPLSEDLLKYTPQGGNAEVPVAAAINIAHQQTEQEADRKLKAHSPNEHVFLDLVTLGGTLKLRNFEKVEASLLITASVPGKPLEASDDGQVASDSARLQLLERAGSINWSVKLKAGEEKALTYKYERYVPSQ